MPYNFYWTGETIEGLFLESINKQKGTYEISTVPAKKRLLERIYGELFDLTDGNNQWINENIIEPYISAWISKKMLEY